MKKIFSLLALAALSACASTGGPSCPETGLMDDASSIAFFANAKPQPGPEDVSVRASLKHLTGTCKLKGDTAYLTFSVDAVAERMRAARDLASQNLSYFIAVLGPDDEILQRRQFYTAVAFKDAEGKPSDTGVKTEEHDITVPVGSMDKAGRYKVVVGFTLTPEQVAFNRKRF